jgi:hypothetical protein
MVNRGKRLDRRHLLTAARHPARRDGVIALTLFLLPLAVALALVRTHHHLDSGTVGVFVAVSLGLPTLWVTWAAYRGPRQADTSASSLSLTQLADQLAIAVGAQWAAEAAMRRLNDPYPLPVSWIAADRFLADTWDSLVKLAAGGAGWPPPPSQGIWANSPDNLAGKGGELAEVLVQVPTGRLVVLGEPGSGKTMLMVRLVLDLLARRPSGGRVPFLASAASWDPSGQDLRDWLGAQLLIDHPALAEPPPPGRTESTQAAALLASGLILPVLDGLDEIPEQVRGPAISRINDALRPGEQFVMTCRTQQYRDNVMPQDGVGVTVRGAVAVQLRPLDAEAVRSYLCDDASGPVARARWDPVLPVLGTKTPAGQALSTPLMVSLARTIYNPRPGEIAGALRDPAELCDPALTDRAAVESMMFDAFIPAAYRHVSAGRWKTKDVQRWLVFLARHLERTIGGPDLAWWQLPLAVPGVVFAAAALIRAVFGVAIGIMFGVLIGGVFGGGTGITVGVLVGLLSGIASVAVRARRGLPPPARGIRLRKPSRDTLAFAAWNMVLSGVVIGAFFSAVAGAFAGALVGALAAIYAGFRAVYAEQLLDPGDLSSAASPLAVLVRDRRTGAVFGILSGVYAGLFYGVLIGARTEALFGVIAGIVSGALTIGTTSTYLAAWPYYEIARMLLTLRRRLPWPLMSFLADAHRRGVLRQVGAVYQFRHIELQHRLANRDADKSLSLLT